LLWKGNIWKTITPSRRLSKRRIFCIVHLHVWISWPRLQFGYVQKHALRSSKAQNSLFTLLIMF
jgi:hypothetical protein